MRLQEVNQDGKDKVEMYKWSSRYESGYFSMVHKMKLQVDETYQRGQNNERVLKIARAFNYALFGTLKVAKRKDGSLYVYDGGHRLAAAMKRSDIDKVPCTIVEVDTIEEEARLFLDANGLSQNVSSYQKYMSEIISNDVPETKIVQGVLKKYGYKVADTGSSGRYVRAVRELKILAKRDPEYMDYAFSIIAMIYAGDHIPADVIKGMTYLKFNTNFDFKENAIVKLQVAGPIGIKIAITRKGIEMNMNRSILPCGLALLDIVNKGLRKKYKVLL